MKRFHNPRLAALMLTLTLSVGLFFAAPVLAQAVNLAAFGEAAGFSTSATIPVIVARLIRTVISITGVIAVVLIIFGGFKFMTAAGDPTKIQSAKRTITNAVVGLVIVFASFAITQFILNSLIDATGGNITTTSSTYTTTTTTTPSAASFYLMSVNNECAEAITNLQLQFVFNKTVDASTVDAGILITDVTGFAPVPVVGNFDVSGKNITFTPSMVCPEDSNEFCFNDSSNYQIDLPVGVLKDTANRSLQCFSSYPCTFTFTTGTEIDTVGPTVGMNDPDNGDSVFQDGLPTALRADTTDDTGISTVDFYVVSSGNPVFTAGLPYSTATTLTGGNVTNTFFTNGASFTEWDTSSYVTNQEYKIWAVGNDCAGNTDTSAKVEVVLRAANCNNAALDASSPFSETGSCLPGDPCDCGGDDLDSIYYCGACAGAACERDADCSTGECVDGMCVDRVKITDMSPGNGAVGNLVTIEGVAFGVTPGTITFLGATGSADDVSVGAYTCNSVLQWTNSEIIVEVPAGALDGPMSVTTGGSAPETDTTIDNYGPNMGDFDVNAIVRPGICSYSPTSAEPDVSVDVTGIRFNATRGSSEFLLGGFTPGTYLSWTDAVVDVTIPNINAGLYNGQIQTGDFVCIDSGGTATGELCSEDADCLIASGETCAFSWCSETLAFCVDDDDCPTGDGTCESIRVGSNQVKFTVDDPTAGQTPIISSVDTGWKACTSSFGIGAHCGTDADCSLGETCEDAGDVGPPGQYMTIYGTGFGTSIGYVWLENQSSGLQAIGDADFPAVCDGDFWHDNYITIKVPEEYTGDPSLPAVPVDIDTYDLSVQRQDGGESDPVDFDIVNDSPGPSICRISPSAGPEGTMVTLAGENFGGTPGAVEFYELLTVTAGGWVNDQITFAEVPVGTLTGPVFATESVNSYTSNSVNFSVGDCREDQGLCSTTESCCADGTCSTSCPANTAVASHYAYQVTTGVTPLVPEVVVACTGGSVQSPSPWEGWSNPEDICVNVNMRAEFTLDIDPTTLTYSTVVVEECILEDPLTGECDDSGWSVLPDASGTISTPARAVIWAPAADLDASTIYRVTLDGDGILPDIQATAAEGGGYLARDYSWQFRTRDNTDYCEVGDVLITPNDYTTRDPAALLDYYGSLVAANDSCISLSCNGYSLDWSSDNTAATVPTVDPPVSDCSNIVTVVSETLTGIPAVISAEVDAEGTPNGTGDLHINFIDPKVKEYFPDCSEACVNALPFAEFNTEMVNAFTYEDNVNLYTCTDSLCHIDELTLVPASTGFVSSVGYSTTTNTFQINFDTNEYMTANTWYRVWVDGTVESTTGVALDESGSNYGSDANLYFPDDFSWKFKTKDSSVICSIDSVSVDPALQNMSYIGERAEFDATAFGAPDDCSISGQALQSGSYTWNAWISTDTPNSVGSATGSSTPAGQADIVGYMVSAGAIQLTTEFPVHCNSACLFAGAPVTDFDSVCGNSSLEMGEDCDDSSAVCNSACLFDTTLVTQCAEQCVGSGATCTSDSACDETCAGAVCTSAVATSLLGGAGDVCAADNDCVSGLCADDLTCYDYEDAGDTCTSDGACSSNSCIGSCSISSVSCTNADSTACPYYSGDTCDTIGTGCCGDGTVNAVNGEECDDGDIVGGDGCSALCQNEGSGSVGAFCGDGITDHNPVQGGEDCDDGNTSSGDGCSRFCLNEGSTVGALAYSSCGDGVVGLGEECDDLLTDGADGVMENGDGCSIACLNEGSLSVSATCGDGHITWTSTAGGEDCDDGNTDDGDGCSADCLNEGSSFDNATISFCGDGVVTWDGTDGGEECDAGPLATYVTGDYGVGIVATGAPAEVNPATSLSKATVSVIADGKTGKSTLQLECSCERDNQCSTDGSLGCGNSGCCVPRPEKGVINPADNTSSPGAGYCRNTAVWVEFTEDMDDAFFDVSVEDPNDLDDVIDADEYDANLYLVLTEINGVTVDSTTCPDSHLALAMVDSDQPLLVRAWSWLKRTVRGLFGRSVSAGSITSCFVPLSYHTQQVDTDGDSVIDSMRVYLRYENLLEEYGEYKIVMLADNLATDTLREGLLSTLGGTLCVDTNCTDLGYRQSFYVGDEICELEEVVTEDQGDIAAASYESASIGLFTSSTEVHGFLATPYTVRTSGVREEIAELSTLYEWEWSWFSTSVADVLAEDIVGLVTPVDAPSAQFQSEGADGDDYVIATANIVVDNLFDPTTAIFDPISGLPTIGESGTASVTALLCENVWPSLSSTTLTFPYVESDLPSYFTFYYCRDFGEDGQADDLASLADPIEVSSLTSTGIQKELIFQVDGESDAIGVRVIPNDDYLSPSSWVEAQGFTGTFTELNVDGYQAVQSGTTYYVAAANEEQNVLYPNMYVISSNQDAEEESLEIFTRVMETFAFNANDTVVGDVGICENSTGYITDADGNYVSCQADSNCYASCEDGTCSEAVATDITCASDKSKLTRDMKRLTDIRTLNDTLDAYGEANMHCEITKGQSCDENADCPGTEECIEGYPSIENGTFIPSMTNSIWGSWNSELANALGSSLPVDPLNEFFLCPEKLCENATNSTFDGISCSEDSDCGAGGTCNDASFDPASCWDGEVGVFECPDDSHLYGYQSIGGEAYVLYAELELAGERAWFYDIDTSAADNATLNVEYPDGHAPTSSSLLPLATGFSATAIYCDGSTWGDSQICGDGIQGVSEICEIGDTDIGFCDYDLDGVADDGQITTSCYLDSNSLCAMQTVTEAATEGAECFPFECGNGVVDGSEACDDGSLNGTYGFCGNDCTYSNSFYCGDGFLAGGEACDCGTTANFTSLLADPTSWAALNTCGESNGQYTSNIDNSCAYNCTVPGLACGDTVVNGTEECDGNYEEYEGMLCNDQTRCSVEGETCDDGSLCGSAGLEACGTGDACADYSDAGDACESDADCDNTATGACSSGGFCISATDVGFECNSTNDTYIDGTGSCETGSCPDLDYDLFRYRTCGAATEVNACEWNTWNDCVGGTQQCGNGTVEGAEACDDGNNSNNDICTNECQWNVCGDDLVYVGQESCDDGNDNGDVCEAGYESTCNYCNELCQYRTTSGGFCGDGELNGNEVCDGSYSTELTWFDTLVEAQTLGSCTTYADTETFFTDDYTCRWIGVCNGGIENGELCTLDYDDYVANGTITDESSGSDRNSCNGGSCVPPVCADSCDSSCPVDYATTGLFVQSELESAGQEDSIDLYSYQNAAGASPDNGILYVPACSVATAITANIDDAEVSLPDVDIIFVTDLSGSMDKAPDGNEKFCNGGSLDGTSCSENSACGTVGTCVSSVCSGGALAGDSCSEDEHCEVSCTAYGTPVGERRIDYVVDATKDAIDDLYDAYDLSDSTLQIGLVSYSSQYRSYWSGGFCNMTTPVGITTYGAWMETFSEPTSTDGFMADDGTNISIVKSLVDGYASCVCEACHLDPGGDPSDPDDYSNSGGTPTYKGLERATIAMANSVADVKIIVLLSDGDPSKTAVYVDGSTSAETCSNETSTHQYSTWSGVPACVADVADNFTENAAYSDIVFYSAAVTTSNNLKGYMAHMSNDECAWGDDNGDGIPDITDDDDCVGNYAFAAEDEDQIAEMYATIVNSILGTNVALSTENSNVIVTTVGEVMPGSAVTLPFPNEFSCDTSEQTVPLRHEFYGDGYMTFSDFTLTYCPYVGSASTE